MDINELFLIYMVDFEDDESDWGLSEEESEDAIWDASTAESNMVDPLDMSSMFDCNRSKHLE